MWIKQLINVRWCKQKVQKEEDKQYSSYISKLSRTCITQKINKKNLSSPNIICLIMHASSLISHVGLSFDNKVALLNLHPLRNYLSKGMGWYKEINKINNSSTVPNLQRRPNIVWVTKYINASISKKMSKYNEMKVWPRNYTIELWIGGKKRSGEGGSIHLHSRWPTVLLPKRFIQCI